MSIAIIIATHGVAAEQLLRTTEMLIGEQENVAFIDFVPGENAETIMGKYQQKLSTDLAHCDQVLFLVDTWGLCQYLSTKSTCTSGTTRISAICAKIN